MQRGVPLQMVPDYPGHKNFGRSYPVKLASWWPTPIRNLHSFFATFCDSARFNFELYSTMQPLMQSEPYSKHEKAWVNQRDTANSRARANGTLPAVEMDPP